MTLLLLSLVGLTDCLDKESSSQETEDDVISLGSNLPEIIGSELGDTRVEKVASSSARFSQIFNSIDGNLNGNRFHTSGDSSEFLQLLQIHILLQILSDLLHESSVNFQSISSSNLLQNSVLLNLVVQDWVFFTLEGNFPRSVYETLLSDSTPSSSNGSSNT